MSLRTQRSKRCQHGSRRCTELSWSTAVRCAGRSCAWSVRLVRASKSNQGSWLPIRPRRHGTLPRFLTTTTSGSTSFYQRKLRIANSNEASSWSGPKSHDSTPGRCPGHERIRKTSGRRQPGVLIPWPLLEAWHCYSGYRYFFGLSYSYKLIVNCRLAFWVEQGELLARKCWEGKTLDFGAQSTWLPCQKHTAGGAEICPELFELWQLGRGCHFWGSQVGLMKKVFYVGKWPRQIKAWTHIQVPPPAPSSSIQNHGASHSFSQHPSLSVVKLFHCQIGGLCGGS